MPIYNEETLLIITKTYPSPSSKYREISCVAALNKEDEMRRLFPVPFRLLEGDKKFVRWEWIKARTIKANNDHRPESYKIDLDSIVRLSQIGTEEGWAERLQWISPHVLSTQAALEERRQNTGETLGFIRPTKFKLVINKSDSSDWTESEKMKLIQDGLFDKNETKNRFPLRKIPHDFYYEYECRSTDGSTNYRHKITDWEIGALYWNCVNQYGQKWEGFFRKKLEDEFSQKKDLYFLMGTMHRFPDKWLIVGLVYPPKLSARQELLWLSSPDA